MKWTVGCKIGLAILVTIVTLVGALLPVNTGTLGVLFFSGYQVHFLAFFLLAWTAHIAVEGHFIEKLHAKHHYTIATIYGIIIALLVEVAQLAMAYRTFSWLDFVWSSAGVLTFLGVSLVIKKMISNLKV